MDSRLSAQQYESVLTKTLMRSETRSEEEEEKVGEEELRHTTGFYQVQGFWTLH